MYPLFCEYVCGKNPIGLRPPRGGFYTPPLAATKKTARAGRGSHALDGLAGRHSQSPDGAVSEHFP
jgi:hypothetical protein